MQATTQSPEGVTPHAYVAYPDLRGVTVLVTGAATGIGAYTVNAFAAQGARVAFLSLPTDPGELLAEAVAGQTGNRPLFVPCDLADPATLSAAVARVQGELGDVGVLVNNAARDDRHSVDDLPVEGWDALMNVNLRPHFLTVQAVVAGMRRRGGGSIVNMGSNSSMLGLAGFPAYVAAKHAVIGLSRGLARDLGSDGIRVNSVLPGWVLTERQKQLWVTPEAVAQCLSEQALKRTMVGEDIAEAVLFLASGAASMITGQSLVVDGGRFMH